MRDDRARAFQGGAGGAEPSDLDGIGGVCCWARCGVEHEQERGVRDGAKVLAE